VFSICCELANFDICRPDGSPLRERDAEFDRKSLKMLITGGLEREKHDREPNLDEIEEETGRAPKLQRELANDETPSVRAHHMLSGLPKTSLSSDKFPDTSDLRQLERGSTLNEKLDNSERFLETMNKPSHSQQQDLMCWLDLSNVAGEHLATRGGFPQL
jgi:hypothetical protein